MTGRQFPCTEGGLWLQAMEAANEMFFYQLFHSSTETSRNFMLTVLYLSSFHNTVPSVLGCSDLGASRLTMKLIINFCLPRL